MADTLDRYKDAVVLEEAMPYSAHYKATRKSDGFFYMQISYGNIQSRKWVDPKNVRMKRTITEVFIEKVWEL